jgi:hypothetical protein
MPKPFRKKETKVSWCKCVPIKTKLMDPYSPRMIDVGEEYILSDSHADYLVATGMVKVIEDDVPSPWEPKPAPAPVVEVAKPKPTYSKAVD